MIRFLESRGMKFIHAHWPDYYDSRPGGIVQGRSLAAPLFNVNELGEWAPKLARHPFTSKMPIGSPEAVTLFTAKKTWRGKLLLAKIALRVLRNKLLRQDFRGAGNALQGRLYQIAFREGIPVWTDTPVRDFLVEDSRVTGVLAEQNGRTIQVKARLGVLVNAGGFSRNLATRGEVPAEADIGELDLCQSRQYRGDDTGSHEFGRRRGPHGRSLLAGRIVHARGLDMHGHAFAQ